MRKQVRQCDPLTTHGPHLRALEMQHDKAIYKFTLLSFQQVASCLFSSLVVQTTPICH